MVKRILKGYGDLSINLRADLDLDGYTDKELEEVLGLNVVCKKLKSVMNDDFEAYKLAPVLEELRKEEEKELNKTLKNDYGDRICIDFNNTEQPKIKNKNDNYAIDITHKAKENVVSGIEDLKAVLDFGFNGSLTKNHIDMLNKKRPTENGRIVFNSLDIDTNFLLFDARVIRGETKPKRKDGSNYPIFVTEMDMGDGNVYGKIGHNVRVSNFNNTIDLSMQGKFCGVNLQLIGLTTIALNNAIFRHDVAFKNIRPIKLEPYSVCTGIEECPSIRIKGEARINVNVMGRREINNVKHIPNILNGTSFISSLLFNNYVLNKPVENDYLTSLPSDEVMKSRSFPNNAKYDTKLESYIYGKHLSFMDIIHTNEKDKIVRPSNYNMGFLTIKKGPLDATIEENTTIGMRSIYSGSRYNDSVTKECYIISRSFAEHSYEAMKNKSGLLIPYIEDERFIYSDRLPNKTRYERLFNKYDGLDYGKFVFMVRTNQVSKPLYYKNYHDDMVSEVREIGLHPYLSYLRECYRSSGDEFTIAELEKRLDNMLGNKLFSIEYKRVNLSNLLDENAKNANPLLEEFLIDGGDDLYLKIEDELIPILDLTEMKERSEDVHTDGKVGYKGVTLDENEHKEGTVRILSGVKRYLRENTNYDTYTSICFYKIRNWNISELISDRCLYRDDVTKVVFGWKDALSKLKDFRLSDPVGFDILYICNKHPGHKAYFKIFGKMVELTAKEELQLEDGLYLTMKNERIHVPFSDFDNCGIGFTPKDVEASSLSKQEIDNHVKLMEKLTSINKDVLLKMKHGMELHKAELAKAKQEFTINHLKEVIERLEGEIESIGEDDERNLRRMATILKMTSDASSAGKNIVGMVDRLLDFIQPF